jgi:hypothetical protein
LNIYNGKKYITSTIGDANKFATPEGLAGPCFLRGVFISLFNPVGLAGDLLTLALNSSFTPTRLVLFLDFFAEDLADERGETSISPGPFGVSGISAYRTESGVPADNGVVCLDFGDDCGGVVNRSLTPARLTLPTDFLLFCKHEQLLNVWHIM